MTTNGYDDNENLTIWSKIVTFKNKHWKNIAYGLLIIIFIISILVGSIDKVKELLSVQELLFIYLYLILMVVMDISITINSNKRKSIRIKEKQDKSMPVLIDYVQQCSVNDTSDLIEYAGQSTLPLIREIKDKGLKIRLLIQHPDNISGAQKQRSLATLDTLYKTIFSGSTNFEIRCYKQPYTLRGRKIGDKILELGWLTPDIQNKTTFGLVNPSVLVDLSDRKNDYLLKFFKKTFNDLWNDSHTDDGNTVLNKYQTAT